MLTVLVILLIIRIMTSVITSKPLEKKEWNESLLHTQASLINQSYSRSGRLDFLPDDSFGTRVKAWIEGQELVVTSAGEDKTFFKDDDYTVRKSIEAKVQ